MEELLKPAHHTDWILLTLLGGTVLVLTARLYSPIRFRGFLTLPFHVKRTEFEESFNMAGRRSLFEISLGLLSYVIFTLGIFLVLHPYGQGMPLLPDWFVYLRLLFVVAVFFIFKNLVGLFVGWVFDNTEEIAGAQNVNLAYRAWTSIFIIPLAAVMVFYAPAYKVGYFLMWICLCLGYYFALQFSFFKIWKIQAAAYYKIFYLCALEITPLLFLVGWLKSLYP